MTNCTTHHHACDCREAMFVEMVEALKTTTSELKVFLAMLYSERTRAELQVVVGRAAALIARATDQGEMK